jgi:hypothetical protein
MGAGKISPNRMILMEHWNSLDITYGTSSRSVREQMTRRLAVAQKFNGLDDAEFGRE